jgi:hypothetical protein
MRKAIVYALVQSYVLNHSQRINPSKNIRGLPTGVQLGLGIGLWYSFLSLKGLADKIDYSYSKPEHYSVVTVPLPKLRDNDILVCYSNLKQLSLNIGELH